MSKQAHTPKQITQKLREAEVELAQGATLLQVAIRLRRLTRLTRGEGVRYGAALVSGASRREKSAWGSLGTLRREATRRGDPGANRP